MVLRLLRLAMLLIVGVVLASCDGNEVRGDAERLVGTWVLVEAEDDRGERSLPASDVGVELRDDNSFGWYVPLSGQADDEVVRGTYTVDAERERLTLTDEATRFGVEVRYRFEGNGRVVWTAAADVLDALTRAAALDLDGTAALTFEQE